MNVSMDRFSTTASVFETDGRVFVSFDGGYMAMTAAEALALVEQLQLAIPAGDHYAVAAT